MNFKVILKGTQAQTIFKTLIIQTRNTFIVKRKFNLPTTEFKSLRKCVPYKDEHFLYDVVGRIAPAHRPNISVILLTFIEGIGQTGEVVSVRPEFGRSYILLKKAVYATPENLKEYAVLNEGIENLYSSRAVPETLRMLASQVCSIPVSSTEPWKIEPWLVRAGLRFSGLSIPEGGVEIPGEEISGPDLDLQNKEFIANVIINNTERAPVRCRIHHIGEKLHPEWKFMAAEPVFSDQAELLAEMPLPKKEDPRPVSRKKK